MAHCLQFEGTTFICNSDLSGYVTIVPGLPSRAEVSVPCEAVVEFVAEFVRREKIAKLEEISARELLGLE